VDGLDCIGTGEAIDDDEDEEEEEEMVDLPRSKDTCRVVSCECEVKLPSSPLRPNEAMPSASEAASIVPFGGQRAAVARR
jgi:hypothetical protein